MKRQSLFWVGLAGVLVLVGFLGGRSRSDGPPLDPDSTGPLGTKALTELAEAFGSDVRRGLPTDDTTTALVLADRLGNVERQSLEEWVRSGGTLVVSDPGSPLSPALADLFPANELEAGACSIDRLQNLQLEGSSFGRYAVDDESDSCFRRDDLAYLVSDTVGSGRIISLGSAVIFTNENLDEGDNAVLAVELLVADGGELAIVFDPGAIGGDRGLIDLIPTRVRWFGWQLLLAFVVYLLWRIRRFGRVVLEPQVVEMPGSLLVRASGELSRRAVGHQAAAARLTTDLERRLRRRYRIAPDVTLEHLIVTVADRSSVNADTLRRALSTSDAIDREALVALLQDIDAVNAACLADTTSAVTSMTDPVPDPVPEGAQHV